MERTISYAGELMERIPWDSHWLSHPIRSLLIFGVLLVAVRVTVVGIYRLYFSPLAKAKIPGPKLAAFTYGYEHYYEVALGGQFFRKIAELHKQYGPIVRITPHEVHFSDPEILDDIYPIGGRKTDKPGWIHLRSGISDSMIATVGHDLHRQRRNAVNNFFSNASVYRLENVLRDHIQTLLSRLTEHGKSGDVLQVLYMLKAFTSDLMTFYAFDDSLEILKSPDYGRAAFDVTDDFFHTTHFGFMVPWFMDLFTKTPTWLAQIILPKLKEMRVRKDWWLDAVRNIVHSPNPDRIKTTIFEGMVNSKLSAADKTDVRLSHEAQLIVFGGEGSTAWTLNAAIYEILNAPDVLAKLKKELEVLETTPDGIPKLHDAEVLPYLAAVIQETIRMHPGVIIRQMRVSPETPIEYKDQNTGKEYSVPPGTVYSMSPRDSHMDPKYFENPHEFRPERWVENPKLSRYFHGFGRGSRNCLGMTLARRELAMVLSSLFLKYDLYRDQEGPTMELIDTTRAKDLNPHSDYIAPFPVANSLGVRVKFRQ